MNFYSFVIFHYFCDLAVDINFKTTCIYLLLMVCLHVVRTRGLQVSHHEYIILCMFVCSSMNNDFCNFWVIKTWIFRKLTVGMGIHWKITLRAAKPDPLKKFVWQNIENSLRNVQNKFQNLKIWTKSEYIFYLTII